MMSDRSSHKTSRELSKWLRLIPFIVLGGAVFALNSKLELNYMLKGYLVLLEAQVGIVVFYFLLAKMFKKNRKVLNKI